MSKSQRGEEHRLAYLMLAIAVVTLALVGGGYALGERVEVEEAVEAGLPVLQESPDQVEALEFGPLDRPAGTAPADPRRPATSPEVMAQDGVAVPSRMMDDQVGRDREPRGELRDEEPLYTRTIPADREQREEERAFEEVIEESVLEESVREDEYLDEEYLDEEYDEENGVGERYRGEEYVREEDGEEGGWEEEEWAQQEEWEGEERQGLESWAEFEEEESWRAEAGLRAGESFSDFQEELDRFETAAPVGGEEIFASMVAREAANTLYWLSAELGTAQQTAADRRVRIEEDADQALGGEGRGVAEEPGLEEEEGQSVWMETVDWLREIQEERFPELDSEVDAVEAAAVELEEAGEGEEEQREALMRFFTTLEEALGLMVDVELEDIPTM